MSVALRGTPSGNNVGATAATNVVFTRPSGVVAGDIVLIFCAVAGAITTWSSTGFTAITAASTAGKGASQLLWKVATGSEASTYTATAAAGRLWAGAICALSGSSLTPFDPALAVSGQINGTTSTTISCSGITTATANDLLIWFGWTEGGAPPPQVITVPAGFTAQITETLTTNGTADIGLTMATAAKASPGATGAENGSTPLTAFSGAMLLGIQPVAAGAASLAAAGTTAAIGSSQAPPAGGASFFPGRSQRRQPLRGSRR